MTNTHILTAAQYNKLQDERYKTSGSKLLQSQIYPRLSINYGFVKEINGSYKWTQYKRDLIRYTLGKRV